MANVATKAPVFRWIENPEEYSLMSEAGRKAASVFKKRDRGGRVHNWFVWDEQGTGGENHYGYSIEAAMKAAEKAVLRWGLHAIDGAEEVHFIRTVSQFPHAKKTK